MSQYTEIGSVMEEFTKLGPFDLNLNIGVKELKFSQHRTSWA